MPLFFVSVICYNKLHKFSGELVSSDEGEVFWRELSELKNLDLAEGMDKQLEVFFNDDLSEDFFYKGNGSWIEVIK